MTNSKRLSAFKPKDEHDIPPWPYPDPPPSHEERVYVLGLKVSGGQLAFYFVERPPLPDPTNDGPLQIRVPTDCVIVLRLDSAWNWQFVRENAVTLGSVDYPEKPRYFNLEPKIENGRCQEVRFNALFLDIGDDTNSDPYALYIQLEQLPQSAEAPPLIVRIDPDIENPGNHPHG
jgi:hypothetical protein